MSASKPTVRPAINARLKCHANGSTTRPENTKRSQVMSSAVSVPRALPRATRMKLIQITNTASADKRAVVAADILDGAGAAMRSV